MKNKAGLFFFGALVAGAMIAVLVSRGHLKAKLREQSEELVRQADQVGQLEAENERLSNGLAAAQSLPQEQLHELQRLRSEVGDLRRQTNELQNSLAQTRIPVAATSPEALQAASSAMQRQADVTAAVRAMVASGSNSITAGNGLFEDPASGRVKRFRVEFEIGGQRYTNETSEGASLQIPAGAEVVRAIYGDFPWLEPNKDLVDVRAKIAAMIANGESTVKAANALVGFDPAPNIGKILRVELRVDGASQVLEANEGEAIDIPAGAAIIGAIYGDVRGREQ